MSYRYIWVFYFNILYFHIEQFLMAIAYYRAIGVIGI